jgi:hypothetical protein
LDAGGVLALPSTLVASNPSLLLMVPSTAVLLCCYPEAFVAPAVLVLVSPFVLVFLSPAVLVFVAAVWSEFALSVSCNPRFVCVLMLAELRYLGFYSLLSLVCIARAGQTVGGIARAGEMVGGIALCGS